MSTVWKDVQAFNVSEVTHEVRLWGHENVRMPLLSAQVEKKASFKATPVPHTQTNDDVRVCVFLHYRCGKTYKQKTHLLRHLNYECGVEPRFTCVCGRKFKQRSNFNRHFKTAHQQTAELEECPFTEYSTFC
ncbi:hypothetical protein GWI33_014885 [Rhynchophorus ferrugineus]|uniref:C2H2-type domain-containing protein n=1 Tax=Rhynchophorus ferrugineus TaxID=354439 RepID=A0A834M528_RHYFE|nr:hypothetical protein GWI33_014885 [Rhynchophorus ferrugineus]